MQKYFLKSVKTFIHALKILIVDFINTACQQNKSNISSLILKMCKCHHYSIFFVQLIKKMGKDLKTDKGNIYIFLIHRILITLFLFCVIHKLSFSLKSYFLNISQLK